MRHACWILLFALPLGAPRLGAQEEHHGRGGSIIPDSSLESPFDIGVSSHTNHMIRIRPASGTGPGGTMVPSDLGKYYGMPSGAGSNAIAVVVAYHYSNALTDFNTFSGKYGLPKETSKNATAASNSVFQVVYGSGRQPRSNSGWSQEAALDIEWSHAMAPGAKIYLVEAASSFNSDLLTAVATAATIPGVRQISMSWGGSEFSTESASDGYFTKTGICFFAASGDTGGQIIWPSVSAQVVAAGGTSLNTDSSHNFVSETGWSGSGGGNSLYVAKPTWQVHSGTTPATVAGGSNRSVPDLSSDADPNTGVLVVWNNGLYEFGGTSVASPCLAGMANACGVSTDSSTFLSDLYARYFGATSPYYDPISGTAGGFTCDVGWDFVTGVGSPRGTASFGK